MKVWEGNRDKVMVFIEIGVRFGLGLSIGPLRVGLVVGAGQILALTVSFQVNFAYRSICNPSLFSVISCPIYNPFTVFIQQLQIIHTLQHMIKYGRGVLVFLGLGLVQGQSYGQGQFRVRVQKHLRSLTFLHYKLSHSLSIY